MNYNFPYYSMYPSIKAGKGILGLFGRNAINWSGIISGTQKTLGLVNQAIPMIKQVSPIVKNAKTMFKVMNEFKKVDTPKKDTINNINTKEIVEVKNKENNVDNMSKDGPI